VLDVLSLRVKSGISHLRLRPTLAVVDPRLTVTQPAAVTAASGMDVLCHAIESFTAKPYTEFDRKKPEERVPYCGSNPMADMFAEQSLRLLSWALPAAVADGDNLRARADMALAATFAGLGFGNAGVHIPHANAYPIAGQVRDFHPDGYPEDEPMVPHGMAVSLTAPAAFRFTYEAAPRRHERVARLLAPDLEWRGDAAEHLPAVLLRLMREIGIPNGIGAVGYGESDVDDLVQGTLKQQRLLATAPRDPSQDDLAAILRASMVLW
jgi:alcohol dehydrogenase class IV